MTARRDKCLLKTVHRNSDIAAVDAQLLTALQTDDLIGIKTRVIELKAEYDLLVQARRETEVFKANIKLYILYMLVNGLVDIFDLHQSHPA